jgi:chromatin remodeling complex protein RSC6
MPKQTKNMNSKSSASVSASNVNDVSAPVSVSSVDPPVVVEKKKTESKRTKSTKPQSTTEAPSSPPLVVESSTESSVPLDLNLVQAASSATVAAVEADLANVSMAVKLNIFGAKLQQLTGIISSVKSDFKVLEKLVARELKNAQKNSRKKKSNPNRQPSGFVKPTRISDELAQFLGKDIGCEMARTEVSKEINAYICSNKLQDKTNGRIIKADAKLSNLLKLNKEDELTYFNLQRYMKHHFIKNEPVVAITATVNV